MARTKGIYDATKAPVVVLIFLLSACMAEPQPAPPQPEHGHDWLFAAGTTDGRRASLDPDITASTVGSLGVAWNYTTEGAVTGTPTVEGDHVYVATWKGSIVALDVLTGTRVWSHDVGAKVTGSVTLHDGLALFGDSQARVHALDAATGAPKWNRTVDPTLNAHLYATPLVVPATAGRDAFIVQAIASDQESFTIHGRNPVTFRGSVVALDLETGSEIWRTWLGPEGTFGAPVWGTPVLVPGLDLVTFGTGNAYAEPASNLTDAIVALRLSDGSIAWAHQAYADDVFTHLNPTSPDVDFGSTPSVVTENGRTLVIIGQKSSIVWAVDASTGKVAWQHGGWLQGEGVIGDTAANDGRVFVPYVNLKKIAALDSKTGAHQWNRSLTGLGFSDPVAIPGAVVAADTNGTLQAFADSSGDLLWQASIGKGGVYGGLSVAQGHLFVPVVLDEFLSEEGAVVAFAPGRGPAASTSAGSDDDPLRVAMRGYEFAPQTRTLSVGDSLTWSNRDPELHTVTFSGEHASMAERKVSPGESATIRFDQPGTYEYYCRPHASPQEDGTWIGMTGTVVVGDGT